MITNIKNECNRDVRFNPYSADLLYENLVRPQFFFSILMS